MAMAFYQFVLIGISSQLSSLLWHPRTKLWTKLIEEKKKKFEQQKWNKKVQPGVAKRLIERNFETKSWFEIQEYSFFSSAGDPKFWNKKFFSHALKCPAMCHLFSLSLSHTHTQTLFLSQLVSSIYASCFSPLTKYLNSQLGSSADQCDQMVRLFFNIWTFAIMKISQIISQIWQSQLSILPKMK